MPHADINMKYMQDLCTFRIMLKDKRRYGSRGRKLAQTYSEHVVRPVNGEDHYNDCGFSQGVVHLQDAATGDKVGWCGVIYFENNAILVDSPPRLG